MDNNYIVTAALEKLKTILVLPHDSIHAVGVGSNHTRKVFFARQVPYRTKTSFRNDEEYDNAVKADKKLIWYKVYTIIDNDLVDLTKLVSEAFNFTFEHFNGISEPISTALIANTLRNAIAIDLKSWGI